MILTAESTKDMFRKMFKEQEKVLWSSRCRGAIL